MRTARAQRSVLGVLGALLLALAAVFAAGPAQAASPSPGAAADQRFIAPPAPSDAQARASLAAASPGISPAVNTQHVPSGGSFSCGDGNFCAAVWDPTTSDWKIFFLFACQRYSVSNWLGDGAYYNQQTGNATASIYGQSGNVLVSAPADGGISHGINWDAVWSIRNC
ncbi:hypothetical protein [Streptomyces ortus]|uniref:Secreted protein n=1 Tax=Streptomyces ortus TaxID=2867268 RepID=A0ABT3VJ62_9ACTN|nr:hypothetical protein [Streptomyces ortus]MCX4238969.1 hypothetical protein [Streptomyces ortus]